MIPALDPPPLRLGPLLVDAAEVLAVLGVCAAALYARARAAKRGLVPRRVVDGFFLLLALALVLGRAFDSLLYGGDGFCSLGAFLGAGLAIALYHREGRRLRWDELDNLAAALPLGWILVRLGCFLERHHAGRRTDFLLAVRYEDGPRHDLGLYDALAGLAIFLLLRALDRRPRPPGLLFGAAALAYGLLRFAIEHLRGEDLERIGRHSDPRYAGLTLVQYAAIVLVAIGVEFLRRARRA